MSLNLVVTKIRELFVVSEKDAISYAKEFLELVSSHSGTPTYSVIDKQVPKVFGDHLVWRKGKKELFEKRQKEAIEDYQALLKRKRRKY